LAIQDKLLEITYIFVLTSTFLSNIEIVWVYRDINFTTSYNQGKLLSLLLWCDSRLISRLNFIAQPKEGGCYLRVGKWQKCMM